VSENELNWTEPISAFESHREFHLLYVGGIVVEIKEQICIAIHETRTMYCKEREEKRVATKSCEELHHSSRDNDVSINANMTVKHVNIFPFFAQVGSHPAISSRLNF